jgi:hypothetical protein
MRIVALLLAAFLSTGSAYIAAHRLLWFDEILTTLLVRLPSVSSIWKALTEVAEQTPFLYFLIARSTDRLLGPSDFAVRAASPVALGVALLLTFDAARRLTDGRYGLIAMSLLATPFVTYYGHEARPYALYLMLSALALWLWITTRPGSRPAAAAFGAVFFAGMAIHYYFLLCLAPFAIHALLERRVTQPKLIAAALGVLAGLAVLSPQIANSRQLSQSISAVWRPTVPALAETYLELLPFPLLALAALAVAAGLLRKREGKPVPAERLAWLFLIVPLLAFLVSLSVTHIFHDRYGIGAAPGIAVGAACFLWRRCGTWRAVSAAAVVLAAGFAIVQQSRALAAVSRTPAESGDYQARTRRVLALEDTIFGEDKREIVFNWDVQYLEAWFYSPHRDRYACVTGEKRWAIRRYVPLRFLSVADLAAMRGQAALVAPSPELLAALRRAGVDVVLRLAGPDPVYYLR